MKPEIGKAPQRTYRKVVEKMLASLNAGEYPSGARLPPERELSERFGVSRPTIREAIIALEVMGRVEVRTGSGVYVLKNFKPATSNEYEYSPFELTETRVLVEAEVAALAASTITDEELKDLDAALNEMAQENEIGNLTSDVADRKFHSIIANSTHNRPLINIIERLWDIQANLPDIQYAHNAICKKDGQRRLEEHRAIYTALAEHDSQKARIAMRAHFTRSLEALHATTEARAVEEIQKQLTQRRERFSLARLDLG